MKTSNQPVADRPRLTCRVVQGWVAVLGDGTAPRAGSWGARHAAACACCSGYFNRGYEMESTLRRGASARSELADDGLEQRINAAVARAARGAAPQRSFSRGGVGALALAGAAAGVAVAIFVAQQPRGAGVTGTKVVGGTEASEDSTDLASSNALLEQLPEAADLLQVAPLQREVDAVYSDARAALGFLAMNFLPRTGEDSGMGVVPPVPARRTGGG